MKLSKRSSAREPDENERSRKHPLYGGCCSFHIGRTSHETFANEFAEICIFFFLQKPLTGHFSQVLSHRFLSQVLSQVSSHRVESQVLSHRSSLTGPHLQLSRYRHVYVGDLLHVLSHRSSLTGLFHRYSFIGPSLIGLFHRFLSQGISSQVSLTGRVS